MKIWGCPLKGVAFKEDCISCKRMLDATGCIKLFDKIPDDVSKEDRVKLIEYIFDGPLDYLANKYGWQMSMNLNSYGKLRDGEYELLKLMYSLDENTRKRFWLEKMTKLSNWRRENYEELTKRELEYYKELLAELDNE